jgi:putative ABC transport system permease protein
MLRLAWRNLSRRPLRSTLTAAGLSVGMIVMGCVLAFGEGYRGSLGTELDRMGMQMMLVPLGCPYDAAARVLKGKVLENSLPVSAVESARNDPAVAVAAPLLIATTPRPEEGRTDQWVGMDRSALELRPWWRAKAGEAWFPDDDSVILGSEAAEVEMRAPGDKLFSPEGGRVLKVAGILERSGTSDDSLFFVPLKTAQAMFSQPGRVTAVAIRLKDPALLPEVSERLQKVPGAQVVTITEMMGTFLNLVGAARALLLAIAVVAIAASALTVFNTLLGSVLEQTGELAVMRAIGASRGQLFALVTAQGLALTVAGTAAGLALAQGVAPLFEQMVRQWVPLAPEGSIVRFTAAVLGECVLISVAVGLLAGLYPAWQASRLQPAAAMRAE